MVFNTLVKAIADAGPQFNHYALKGFVENNINSAAEFISIVFSESFKIVDADLEFVGYTVLTPEETVTFELISSKGKNSKLPLSVSHLKLVEFRVRFGEKIITTKLYVPYTVDGMLTILDRRSMIRKVLLEQTFARTNKRGTNRDGVTVSPIRVNILFNRRIPFKIDSYINRGDHYTHFIVTSRLFHGDKRGRKICETSIILYMLARFGWAATLKKFGVPAADLLFTTEVGRDTETFDYFAAVHERVPGKGPELYVKARRTLLADDQNRKFIINLMYLVKHFGLDQRYSVLDIGNVYLDDGYIWKVILGIINYGDPMPARAYSHAVANLRSVDHFIDPITRERFQYFNVPINDIYDLLVYTFINIDSLMVNTVSQDIYKYRLDASSGILGAAYATPIVKSIYPLARKNRTSITERDVSKALSFSPMLFRKAISSKKDDSEKYIAPPDIIGGNFLLSGGLNKIRIGGRTEQRLHPSMLVVESIGAFVGKNTGNTGYINPYIPVNKDDRHGAIQHPDYADDIDRLEDFIPH